jgi:hypothetical protein
VVVALKHTKLFASTVIALLFMTAVFIFAPKLGPFSSVRASNTVPQTDLEYANGTLTPNNAPFKVWYSWVNTSGTQIIYYAAYTTPYYPYPVPIANIIGQHLKIGLP